MDARTGVLGQLATNRKGSSDEFFSAKVFFKRVRMLVGRDRNIQLLKFSHDVFYCRQPSSQRTLDRVFQGQYLQSLSVNYVAINNNLEKFPPKLH